MVDIVMFSAEGAYGTSKYFLNELARAFHKLGKSTMTINLESPDAARQIRQLMQEGCEFVFSFNGQCLLFKIDERPFHEVLNVPLVAMCIENPMRLRMRFAEVSRVIVTCPDEVLVEAISSRFPNRSHHTQSIELLPHGASDLIEEVKKGSVQEKSERPIDVMFAGSYWDPDIFLPIWREYSMKQQRLLHDVTDYVLTHSGICIEQAWRAVREALPNLSDLYPILVELRLLQLAEYYVGAVRRRDCLKSLADQGVSVHLYGNGWEHHPSIRVHQVCGAVSFPELIKEMRRAKVVLNINPPFTIGSHERPLTAMLQGAAVVTDRNPFYNQQFEEGTHLLTYQWDHLEQLPEAVSSLLRDPEKRHAVSMRGTQRVKEHHTWQHRAERILQLVESHS